MTAAGAAAPARLPGAQTTVRLFEQLRSAGCGRSDLQRIRSACATALELFAACVHTSGKPYLAHCTAAGSTLAALGADVDLVVAGVLHGAYRSGDFGPWRVTLSLKRRYVQRRFGARVDDSIFRFFTQAWNVKAIEAYGGGGIDALDTRGREVLLMRLASELDNLRDRSLLYRADADKVRDTLRTQGALLVSIADRLGVPQLSGALAAAVADTLDATVAPELRSDFARVSLIPPPSARLRVAAVLTRAVQRLRRQALRGASGRASSAPPRVPD